MIDPFCIQTISPCPLDDVSLIYDPAWDRFIPKHQQKQALHRWNQINRERANQGSPLLQDLLLFRPEPVRQHSNGVQINCGMTSYLVNFTFSAPCEHWKDNLLGAGLSIVPVCIDDGILIGRRSSMVYQGQGRFHVTGGHAHPKPDFRNSPDTLHDAAFQELNEEMKILPSDIQRMEFLGIGMDRTTSKPEFLTRVFLKQKSQVYINRWENEEKDNPDREFDQLTTLDTLLKEKTHPVRFTMACRMALKANNTEIHTK